MRIDSSGNVGIGDASPSEKLNVAGNIMLEGANQFLYLTNVGTGNNGIYVRGITADATLRSHSTGIFTWEVTGSEKMRIDASGRVGIGTSSPTNTSGLEIQTSSTTAGLWVQTGGTTSSYNIAEFRTGSNLDALKIRGDGSSIFQGNVGIGTSSPQAELDITDSSTSSVALRVVNTEPTEDSIGSFFSTGSAYSYIGIGANETALYGRTGLVLAADNPGSGWNPIRFSTGGSERMRLDNNGNVGIGKVPADGVRLDVEGDSSGNIYGLRIRNRGQVAGSAVSAIWSLNRDSGGDVNFPAASIKAIKEQNWTTDFSTVDGAMIFETISNEISSEKMRIDSSGNLLVGTTSSNSTGIIQGRHNNGASNAVLTTWNEAGSGTRIHMQFLDSAGGSDRGSITTNGSSTSFNTTSDYRLKENVVELTGATTRLKQLEPKRFNFIADADTTVDGFLAHEVQSIVPEAITGQHNEVDDDGNPVYQGIDQSKLVPLLVATIKELEVRITALENA
jgi:hypothetical protein